jgi:hypothetical protein
VETGSSKLVSEVLVVGVEREDNGMKESNFLTI